MPSDAQEDDIQLSLKLMVVLSKAYRNITAKALKDINTYNLSSTEFGVMEILYTKGKFPIQQIGERLLITSGPMTYNIDKLEKKKLLRRIPSKEDRRVVYVEITSDGKDLFDQIFPQHTAYIHSLMSGFTRKQKLEAIELLKKLGKGVHTNDHIS